MSSLLDLEWLATLFDASLLNTFRRPTRGGIFFALPFLPGDGTLTLMKA